MSYQNVEIRVIRWERIWNYNREGMRDKMSNENVEIRVIKWERIWNYNKEGTNGEREREREMITIQTASRVAEESKATPLAIYKTERAELLTSSKKVHCHTISLDIVF